MANLTPSILVIKNNMSNKSKRKRTDFTRGQRYRRWHFWGEKLSEILYKTYDKSLSEIFSSGFTASTGAEDIKQQETKN